MTRTQRRLLVRISALGVILTLSVIALDGMGRLEFLERELYDLRARHFQFFSPEPSRDVIHIDIDDPSIDEIGRWPWHRTKLAQLIDEMRLAGPKVIALDIIFYEPEDPEWRPAGENKFERIEHDANLARAFERAANVLVPISVEFRAARAAPPLFAAMVRRLEADPELSRDQLKEQLAADGFTPADLSRGVDSHLVDASSDAMFNRLERELSKQMLSADDVRKIVLPRSSAADVKSDATYLLYKTYPSVVALLSLRRFGQQPGGNLQDILQGTPNRMTIPILCDAARYSGYVDFLNMSDGRVRSVPLCASARGRIFPHMVLATACAQLGVDPNAVRYEQDRITIPLPDGQPPIVIPVRSIDSKALGASAMFMDIPWFGTRDYTVMFDKPAYAEAQQRIPIRNVWDIVALQRNVRQNEEAAERAIIYFLATASDVDLQAYEKLTVEQRDASRAAKIAELINDDFNKTKYASAMEVREAQRDAGQVRLIAGYHALLNARDKSSFLTDQISAKRAALKRLLNGRAVMVGWNATGATDRYPTSLHPECPGVSIMSTAVSGILTRDLWRTLPWSVAAVVTLLMGITTSFFVARLSPIPALFCSALLFVAYAATNALLLFDRNNVILPAAGTVTAVALCWSGLTLARFVIESHERARITRRFSNYVDPALVDYVIENPDKVHLDGMVRDMTVVFTDLAGFTTISEKLRERTVPILNDYMSLMVPIIREHKGHWDKFLGDGIMFFYNGLEPMADHAIRAIDTAMEMQTVTDAFNDRLRTRQLPKVAMRVGISTGEMVVGDAGSIDKKHRANNFTVLGDTVNLGARLEGANKPIGTRILINERTADLSDGQFLLRPVGNVRVVGKLEGVQLFEPLCRTEQANDAQKKLVEMSAIVVESFANADFEKCLGAARKMEEELGSAKFSQFYLRIAREHRDNPPKDFEGQIVLSEK